MVYAASLGSRPATILFKYLAQWFETSRILRRERPDITFVMTPPVFAALPAFWYAWRHGKQVVLDAHTAAFLLPRWRHFQPLQRLLCRRATTTLVSNEHLGDVVRRGGGHATLVPDVPVVFDLGSGRESLVFSCSGTGSDREKTSDSRPDPFVVACVCSFDYDEPVQEMFAAAARLPAVQFFMTGNPGKLGAAARTCPANVTLTGFLSTERYGGLLASADAVLVLTTYDHTMLRGAYEAIYQGTPVIVSDWPLLRDAFPEGAIHVDNTAHGIAEAIRTMQAASGEYRAGAARLREHKLQEWRQTRAAILARIMSRGAVVSPQTHTTAARP